MLRKQKAIVTKSFHIERIRGVIKSPGFAELAKGQSRAIGESVRMRSTKSGKRNDNFPFFPTLSRSRRNNR